jgi:hypothetical protein
MKTVDKLPLKNKLTSLFEGSQFIYGLKEILDTPFSIGECNILFSHDGGPLTTFEVHSNSGQDSKYRRFGVEFDRIQCQPSLLDRPLVLALEHPVYISPRSHLQINLSRPIAFELTAIAANDKSLKLCIMSTKNMRLTSYGQVTRPMICYHWQASTVSRPVDGNEALVPIMIYNQTKQVVELKKLILDKVFLKIFKNEDYFITSQVKVQITSKSEAYLEYLNTPPPLEGDCRLVFESSSDVGPKFLKILRLMGKRGTGIEYGF